MIINEIVRIKKILFSNVTFSLLSNVSLVFNISSSHFSTNLKNRCFLDETFLISKYSSISQTLLHCQSHVVGFHMQSFLQESQSSNSLQPHRHSL